MCFHYKIDKPKKEIEKRFEATFEFDFEQVAGSNNGFEHPKMPIILDTKPQIIMGGIWGLLPTWAKDTSIQKNTLNARIESLEEKPSFRDSVNKRCLIPATSFLEWQWLDEKGKQKRKYEIFSNELEIFSFAGIYNVWKAPDGSDKLTYTILTTEADDIMAKIHNTKKRMPIILNLEDEKKYLSGVDINGFAFPYTSNKISF